MVQVARSKIKTSFEMSLDNDWSVNFIENEDGTKTIELGMNEIYPIQIHFGYDKDFQTKFIEVFNTLKDPDVPFTITEWDL